MYTRTNESKVPLKNRVILAMTRAAGLAATAAAIAASLTSQGATLERKIVGLEVEVSRWLPNISAALNGNVSSSGVIEGVTVTSLFGSESFSLSRVREGMVVPNFNGERLLAFGVASSFSSQTGGDVKLIFKAASSVGGGCRQLVMTTYKSASSMRLSAYNPYSAQPLAKIMIAAPQDGAGRRSVTEVVLTDYNGKEDSLNIARLPAVGCPW
jgi:hypothetical protein